MAKFEDVKVSVLGNVLFPKTESGKWGCALELSDKYIKRLALALHMSEEEFRKEYIHEATEKETGVKHEVFNSKSSFEFTIYDYSTGLPTDLKPTNLYHGAECVVSLVFKEYTYMKKTGITSYIQSVALIVNGEAPRGGFDAMMSDIDPEDLPQF